MCLITRQQEPIILKEDLEVYKVIRLSEKGVYKSFFYGDFEYELNKLYSTTILQTEDVDKVRAFDNEVEKTYNIAGSGFDSYKGVIKELKNKTLFTYGQGFHSIVGRENTKRKEPRYLCRRIVKCIVPKGSEVYYDETGLCVSNQIIVKKLLKKGRYK